METKEPIYLLKKSKKNALQLVFSRLGIILVFLLLQILLLFNIFNYVSTNYVHVFYGGAVLVTLFGYIYLLNSGTDSSVKLTWMVIFTVLPIIGIFLYFYLKLDLGHRWEKRRLIRLQAESNHLIKTDSSVELKMKDEKDLQGMAKYIGDTGCYPVYDNIDMRYFPTGEDKFADLIHELRQAETFIFMEYFIVAEGIMWGTILDILIDKAAAGVEIRFLYDGFNEFSNLSHMYPKKLEKLGIKCKIFAPIHPFVSTIYNFRDHRKICVIDGRVAYTGGVNLADEYINEIERFGYWKDTAIKIKGQAVDSFTLMFLQMWAMDDGVVEFSNWLNLPQEKNETEGFVIPYGDDPLDADRVGEFIYIDILNKATDYVYIMTPYLILDDEMDSALRLAARKGVDVKIIMPHIPDKKYAFALAKNHYKSLIQSGVHIYEFTPGFIHAKVFLSDGVKGTVGTVNLDYRSFYHHFECGVYIEKAPVLNDIAEDFQETLAQSQLVTLEMVRNEKFLMKLAGWLLKVFAPLM